MVVFFGILIGIVALAVIIVIALAINSYMANAAQYHKPLRGVPYADEMTLVSHRGLGSVAPENTLAAFRKSGENGFKYVECDVHATKDGTFVISHDPTLNRMTNSVGEISLKTLEQVREAGIDNGSNHKIYADEQVPTFEEYLDVCKQFGMCPVVEIKQKENFNAKAFCDVLKSKGFSKDNAVVIGYNVDYLKEVREIMPEVKLQILCHNISAKVIEQAEQIGGCGIDVMQNFLKNKELINTAIQKGIEINSWTVDSPRTLKRMYNLGIRMATTNCIIPVTKE